MTALPGSRHRTLAPSSVLRESDVAAIEAANVALKAGARALDEVAIDILGGFRSGWSTGDDELMLTAAAAGDVVRFDIPIYAGSILAAVDLWIWQAVAGAPIMAYVESQRAIADDVIAIADDTDEIPILQYRRRSLGLIRSAANRPLGWVLPIDRRQAPALRIVAGSAGDRITGAVLWYQRSAS